LILFHLLGEGGKKKRLFDVLIGLKNRGHNIHLAYVEDGDLVNEYNINGVSAIKVWKTYFSDKSLACLIKLIGSIFKLARYKYDIVYINEITDVTLGAGIAALTRSKLICHLRLPPPEIPIFKNKKTIIGLLHGSVKSFIVANNNMLESYVQAGLPRDKLNIVNNGFWFEKMAVCSTLKVRGSMASLCYLGRINKEKGLHTLVEAFDVLLRINPKLELSIGGIPLNDEDRNYRDKIVSRINELKIDGNVKFYGHIDDPIKFLSNHHICIFPSICNESFGRVLVESLLAGTPVISRDVGSASEIIDDRGKHWIYESNKELIEKIQILIRAPSLYQMKRKREYIKKEYDLNGIIPKIEKVMLS